MENVLEYPGDAIAAVTHPDPYPYYRKLVEQRPFYYDQDLKLWIAASAATVNEVLTSGFCRVRPLDEPVPRALIDSLRAKDDSIGAVAVLWGFVGLSGVVYAVSHSHYCGNIGGFPLS